MTDRIGRRRAPAAVATATLAVAVVIACSVTASGAGPSVGTQDRDGDEVVALLREAIDDDLALAEVATVTSVDGRPADLAAATAGLDAVPPGAGDRAARLESLALVLSVGSGAGGATTSDGARAAAARVLDDPKFHANELPRPLEGPLRWFADRLRPVGEALGDALDAVLDPVLEVAGAVPGGRLILWALVIAAGAALTVWFVRRRSGAAIRHDARPWLVDPALDPDELDRAAADAEARGAHGDAVRLRYEAGLVRLVHRGRLDLSPATTAADAAAQVGDTTLDLLTADFEAVVYGGRPASAADSERAREGWLDVLGAKASR